MSKWTPPPLLVQKERAEQAYKFYRSKGASHQGASAITATIWRESRFDPNAIGDDGTAIGICQWRGVRQEGCPVDDFEGQLEYMWEELAGVNGNPLNHKTGKGKEGTIPFREAVTDENITSSQIHASLDKAVRWGVEGGRYEKAKEYESFFESKGYGKNNVGFGDGIFDTLKTKASNAVHTVKNAATDDNGSFSLSKLLKEAVEWFISTLASALGINSYNNTSPSPSPQTVISNNDTNKEISGDLTPEAKQQANNVKNDNIIKDSKETGTIPREGEQTTIKR